MEPARSTAGGTQLHLSLPSGFGQLNCWRQGSCDSLVSGTSGSVQMRESVQKLSALVMFCAPGCMWVPWTPVTHAPSTLLVVTHRTCTVGDTQWAPIRVGLCKGVAVVGAVHGIGMSHQHCHESCKGQKQASSSMLTPFCLLPQPLANNSHGRQVTCSGCLLARA
jgi:hypothetical protein